MQHVVRVQRAGRPAQQIERGLVAARLQHLGEVLRLGLRQQVHLDADPRQHADHGLTDRRVVDVAVIRAVHADLEPVGIAGFGQQLLRAIRVERGTRELVRQLEELRRDHQRRWRREAPHDAGLDQIDVDRLEKGLAHPFVLERVLALDVRIQKLVAGLIHPEEDGADFGAGQNLGIGARVHARDVLDRNRLDHVNLTRQQRGDAGGVGMDRREDDLLEIVLRLAPPIRIGLEDGFDARLVALDGEGAGAVGVQRGVARRGRRGGRRLDGIVGFGPLLVHDVPGIPLRIQNGIWRTQDEVDGVIVDLDHLGVGGNAGLQVRALGANAIGGEHHVVGGEGVAVLEFDVLAQMETPARRLGGLPAFGKARNDLQILVPRNEAFIDLPEMRERGGFVEGVGIERLEIALVRITQGLCGGRHRHGRRK